MKYDIIINETSKAGKGADRYEEVRKIFLDKGLEFRVHRTMYPGHATVMARELSGSAEETVNIIVVGGDGTLNEIVNGITDFEKVRVGLIPNGSANDFAAGAGISQDIEREINAIIKNTEEPRRADIGEVSYRSGTKLKKRFFAISSGVGLDALVCKKAMTSKLKGFLNRIGLGKLTYVMLTVYSLFSMKTSGVTIEGVLPGGKKMSPVEYSNLIFAAAMNVKCEGGGVPMAPRAKVNDGCLTMSLAHSIPKWQTFLCFPLLLTGNQHMSKGFGMIKFKEMKIRLSEPFTLHADGESCGEVNSAVFKSLPEKMLILNDVR